MRVTGATLATGAASLVVIAVVALRFAPGSDGRDIPRRPFDAAVWLDPESITTDVRLGMYEDAARVLDGRTQEEVLALLGPPDLQFDGEWQWLMGREPGPFAVDSAWLTIDWRSGTAKVGYTTD